VSAKVPMTKTDGQYKRQGNEDIELNESSSPYCIYNNDIFLLEGAYGYRYSYTLLVQIFSDKG
jgi:hypothetical protein